VDVDEERLRELASAATPGPWFWNSYNAIFAAPLVEEYNRLEALIPKDAPDDDPRWDALPETIVAGGPSSGHGDLPTKAGARDLAYIEAANPATIIALLDELDRLRSTSGNV
jgi:hypothetical protein